MISLNSAWNPHNKQKKAVHVLKKKKKKKQKEKENTKTQRLGLFQLYPNGYKISHAFMRAVTVIIYTYTLIHTPRDA